MNKIFLFIAGICILILVVVIFLKREKTKSNDHALEHNTKTTESSKKIEPGKYTKLVCIAAPELLGQNSAFIELETITVEDSPLYTSYLTREKLSEIPDAFSQLNEDPYGNFCRLYNLAVCYDCGVGTDANVDKAQLYYRLAFQQNFYESKNSGIDKKALKEHTLYPTNLLDVPPAYETAASYNYPSALYLLGMCYYMGKDGIPEDMNKAFLFFKRSYDARKTGYTCLQLGECYFYGRGTQKSEPKALELWSEGYDLFGEEQCGQNYASLLYNSGKKDKALEVLRALAAKGNQFAINSLKKLYNITNPD